MKGRRWRTGFGALLLVLFSSFGWAKADMLVITPEQAKVPVGGHMQFLVQLFNPLMVPIPVQERINWSVQPEWLGKISDDGFFTAGDRPGRGLIEARLSIMGREFRAVAKIEVTGPPTDIADQLELIVQPRQAALLSGEKLQFHAVLRYRDSQLPVPVPIVNWMVKPKDLGKINQAGEFLAGPKTKEGAVVAYVEFMGKRIKGEAHVVVGMKASAAIAGTVQMEGSDSFIANAHITAQRIGDIHWFRSTRSDSAGNYLLGSLIPGHYVVRAEKKGFIAEFYREARTFLEATPVEVAEEDTVAGIDFSLSPGGKISGVITAAADSTPVGHAHVFAFLAVAPRIKFHAFTDENGAYVLEGLPAGSYIVAAKKEGYQLTYYENALRPEDATLVNVAEGETTEDINIALGIKSAIAGQVVSDVDGSPIAGARVSARPLNHPVWPHGMSTRTDENGNYVLQVPPGYYIVRAEADSFNGEYYDNVYDPKLATPVHVEKDAHTEGINFSLAPYSSISGTVVAEADGSPIAGAVVWAFAEIPGGLPVKTRTDDQGNYVLAGLRPGIYFVKAMAPGYYPEFWEEARRLGDADPIAVGYNEQISGINFTLAMAASISGTVVSEEDGSPIVRAVVIAKMQNSAFERKAFTDESGNYTIDGLPPGTYFVMSVAPGFHREFYDNADNREDATPVELAMSEQKTGIDFSLKPAADRQGSISGVVISEADSLPIPGAFVVAFSKSGGLPSFGVTGPDGQYKLTGLATGKYYVVSWAEGYIGEFYKDARNWRKATPVEVISPNETTGIDFTLRPKHIGPYTIRGRILASNNQQPIPNVLVYAVSHEGVLGFGISDENGQYMIPNIPAGHYQLFATAPGLMQNNDGDPATPDSVTVDLQNGQDDYQADITMDVDFMTGVEDAPANTPTTFQLDQNYPNPFNPETEIHFAIPKDGLVTLKVYNALGQEIATLMNEQKAAGRYSLTWNGRDAFGQPVPSGIYFYQLQVKSGKKVIFSQIRKMTLLK